ncbi:TOL [Colletotrichum plurivorum]|uniref:TOL n=1 Tax=Colletotrichum plurivorum TaxID=2175906 RepID=A0A8H6JR84_9PEZI|nr:TOL [Colletotrichum plurivorum]
MIHNVLMDTEWPSAVHPTTIHTELCSRCSNLQLWSTACSFDDTQAGLKSKEANCDLCRLLSAEIKRSTKLLSIGSQDMIIFSRFDSYLTSSIRPGRPIASLYTIPGPNLPNVQTGLPVLPSAGSQEHIRILSEWIKSCDLHSCCPSDRTFLPTRVIQVGKEGSDTCRLICAERGQTNPGRYLALSHRWGSPEQHHRFCTFDSNLESRQQGILVDDLPRTFRDAISITRSLGVDYLWIDSLCIIQDNKEDWEMESRLMEHVYSSAYLTIAASCANGTDDGFLKPRPQRDCVVMNSTRNIPYFVCQSIDDFGHDVDQGELNKRAWVLQERALSCRTLYFTEKQTYWECGKGIRCETFTRMKNGEASFLGDSNFPSSIENQVKGMQIELFQNLYAKYSELALSSNSDRPVAIRGLETRLSRVFDTVGGYGLFDYHMHRCLMWKRASQPLKRIEAFRGGSVPSWSWMAYDGGIRYVKMETIVKETDIVSPFHAWKPHQRNETDTRQLLSVIQAPMWELVDTQSAQLDLDEPGRVFESSLKCIVVARAQVWQEEATRSCFVVLVSIVFDDENRVECHRVGVARLRQDQIDFGSGSRPCFLV